jgi:hypothetical protein
MVYGLPHEKMECNRYFNRSGYRDGFDERMHKHRIHEHGSGGNTHSTDR